MNGVEEEDRKGCVVRSIRYVLHFYFVIYVFLDVLFEAKEMANEIFRDLKYHVYLAFLNWLNFASS